MNEAFYSGFVKEALGERSRRVLKQSLKQLVYPLAGGPYAGSITPTGRELLSKMVKDLKKKLRLKR